MSGIHLPVGGPAAFKALADVYQAQLAASRASKASEILANNLAVAAEKTRTATEHVQNYLMGTPITAIPSPVPITPYATSTVYPAMPNAAVYQPNSAPMSLPVGLVEANAPRIDMLGLESHWNVHLTIQLTRVPSKIEITKGFPVHPHAFAPVTQDVLLQALPSSSLVESLCSVCAKQIDRSETRNFCRMCCQQVCSSCPTQSEKVPVCRIANKGMRLNGDPLSGTTAFTITHNTMFHNGHEFMVSVALFPGTVCCGPSSHEPSLSGRGSVSGDESLSSYGGSRSSCMGRIEVGRACFRCVHCHRGVCFNCLTRPSVRHRVCSVLSCDGGRLMASLSEARVSRKLEFLMACGSQADLVMASLLVDPRTGVLDYSSQTVPASAKGKPEVSQESGFLKSVLSPLTNGVTETSRSANLDPLAVLKSSILENRRGESSTGIVRVLCFGIHTAKLVAADALKVLKTANIGSGESVPKVDIVVTSRPGESKGVGDYRSLLLDTLALTDASTSEDDDQLYALQEAVSSGHSGLSFPFLVSLKLKLDPPSRMHRESSFSIKIGSEVRKLSSSVVELCVEQEALDKPLAVFVTRTLSEECHTQITEIARNFSLQYDAPLDDSKLHESELSEDDSVLESGGPIQVCEVDGLVVSHGFVESISITRNCGSTVTVREHSTNPGSLTPITGTTSEVQKEVATPGPTGTSGKHPMPSSVLNLPDIHMEPSTSENSAAAVQPIAEWAVNGISSYMNSWLVAKPFAPSTDDSKQDDSDSSDD